MPCPVPPAVVLYAFQQSDGFARLVVVLLLIVSVYAWTLIVDKFRDVRRAALYDRRFRRRFDERSHVAELCNNRDQRGPLANVYSAAMDEMTAAFRGDDTDWPKYARGQFPRALTDRETEHVREAMDRTVVSETFRLQDSLNALGTISTVSPFLGLLGTVWGVMAAFIAMAQGGRPDIAAMAPGISGALLTTVVGLLVAIPSVVAYNVLAGKVKAICNGMDRLADEIADDIRREMR